MRDIAAEAKAATKQANASGKSADHATAAKLHKRAAKMMPADGEPEKAEVHGDLAQLHEKKAKKAPDAEPSESTDNPLLAWQNAKTDESE